MAKMTPKGGVGMNYRKDGRKEEKVRMEEDFVWEEDRFPDEVYPDGIVVPEEKGTDPEDLIVIKMIF